MTKIKITDNSIMGIIYALVLAAILTFFIGITLNTFYPAPEYPTEQVTELKNTPTTTAEKEVEAANKKIETDYREKEKDWAQVATIVVITAATFLVALGLYLAGRMPIIPNGVLLGGLFSIFMSIVYSMMSESRYLQFGIVTASLLVIVAAGYFKFVRGHVETTKE